ncbi:hypothetical protein TNCV_4820541 [Trichonephila clavipes]|nr:hypothetical protein TNCV_4820541 [Trichonephila clavipes]
MGYFPQASKTASVISILKPGKDPTLPESFRPNSLLPVLTIGSMGMGTVIIKNPVSSIKYSSSFPLFEEQPQKFGMRSPKMSVLCLSKPTKGFQEVEID